MHEAEFSGGGDDGVDHGGGFRPLQRQQRAVIGAVERGAAQRGGGDTLEIGLLGAGIDDDVERPAPALGGRTRDHQVVMGAALVVEQQGVADLAGLQPLDVAADQRFDHLGDGGVIGLAIARLVVEHEEAGPHVRDIEETGMLAGPFVLGDDAGGVLHRQRIAGERHHAAAERYMLVVEDYGLEVVCRLIGHRDTRGSLHKNARADALTSVPPLSANLRDFLAAYGPVAPSVRRDRLLSRVQFGSGPGA